MVTIPVTLVLLALVLVSLLKGKGASAKLFGILCLALGIYMGGNGIGSGVRQAISGVIGVTISAARAAIGA